MSKPLLQVLQINSKKDIDDYTVQDLELVDYHPHKKIAMSMSV